MKDSDIHPSITPQPHPDHLYLHSPLYSVSSGSNATPQVFSGPVKTESTTSYSPDDTPQSQPGGYPPLAAAPQHMSSRHAIPAPPADSGPNVASLLYGTQLASHGISPAKAHGIIATEPGPGNLPQPYAQHHQHSSEASQDPSREPSRDPSREPPTRYTSYHRTKPYKKHKSNVQACDACAVRKVKCENQRPCTHCVTNKLTCTSLRERKKSGPKNLHKKTLDCISYLNEVIEVNYNKSGNASPQVSDGAGEERNISRSLSQTSETEASQDPTQSPEPHDYKPTPYNLIENINLIAEEPIVFELLKPLTVQSLLINHSKLVDFLSQKFPTSSALHSGINLLTNHDDSIFLSTLLIVLTINMIVAEILIKLKKQKFKDFIKYPKRNLLFRNFKNFKNLCHFKCMEINTLIEKNFIVPPIIPQNNPKNINNINSNHLNQYQIYYNLSLSCLHLCNYYHTLNLTNTLNSTSNLDNNYGNEAQEHHKMINLRKSITYYQLINVKTSDNAVIVQLHELYEILFCYERFYLIYSSNNYNINMFRNNDIIIQLSSNKMLKNKVDNIINNSFDSNILFDLIYIVHEEAETDSDLLYKLSRQTNFNVNPEYSQTPASSTYLNARKKILQLKNSDPIFDVIKGILIFKLWLVNKMTFEESKKEIFWLMSFFSFQLAKNDSDLVKVQMSNYQLLQPLLHLLRIALTENGIEGKAKNGAAGDPNFGLLVEYTDNLIKHFPFFNNINKLIRATKVFSTWFLNLNDNRHQVDEFKKLTSHLQGESKVFSNEPELDASRITIHSGGSSRVVTNQPTPENEEDENDYFAIVPKIQHGHRIGNVYERQGSKDGRSISSMESASSSGTSSVVSNSLEAESHMPKPATSAVPGLQFGGTSRSSGSIGHMAPPESIHIPVSAMNSQGQMGIAYQESVPAELMPPAPPDQPHNKEFNSNSMSESTKNLYNLFNQISDDFMGENTNLSMTNLFQLNGSGFTPHGTPGNHPS